MDQIVDSLLVLPEGTKVILLAPVVGAQEGRAPEDPGGRKAHGVRARAGGRGDPVPGRADRARPQAEAHHRDRGGPARSCRRRAAAGSPSPWRARWRPPAARSSRWCKDKAGEREILFSQKSSCPACGISIPELQPRLFSFNNPFGACPECSGLGRDAGVRSRPRRARREPLLQRGRHRAVQPEGQLAPEPVRVPREALQVLAWTPRWRTFPTASSRSSCTARRRRSASATRARTGGASGSSSRASAASSTT